MNKNVPQLTEDDEPIREKMRCSSVLDLLLDYLIWLIEKAKEKEPDIEWSKIILQIGAAIVALETKLISPDTPIPKSITLNDLDKSKIY